MTLKNLVKRAEMEALENSDRNAILIEKLHVTADDLWKIRKAERVIDRVIEAAAILHMRLTKAGVEDISAQMTLSNFGYLVDDGNLSDPSAIVATALKREYREKRDEVERRTGLSPAYTQLLREDIRAYTGNLYEAKAAWPDISVSWCDWLKDIRIPTSIGREEAIIIGIYLADGNILSSDGMHYKLELWGRNDDFEMYEIIDKRVLHIHNDTPIIKIHNERIITKKQSQASYSYNSPGREISSQAIVTWLVHHCGFSKNSATRRVPSIVTTAEQKTGLLTGIIAASARIYASEESGRTRWRMRIRDCDKDYLASVKALAESLGYQPLLTQNRRYVEFDKKDIKKMIGDSIFIHPSHIEKTRALLEEATQPRQTKRYKIVGDDLELLVHLHNCGVAQYDIEHHFSINPRNLNYYLRTARNAGYAVINRQGKAPQRPIDEVLEEYKTMQAQT